MRTDFDFTQPRNRLRNWLALWLCAFAVIAEFTKSVFKYKNGQFFIDKYKEPVDVRWSQKLLSEPTTIAITKDSAGRLVAINSIPTFYPFPKIRWH